MAARKKKVGTPKADSVVYDGKNVSWVATGTGIDGQRAKGVHAKPALAVREIAAGLDPADWAEKIKLPPTLVKDVERLQTYEQQLEAVRLERDEDLYRTAMTWNRDFGISRDVAAVLMKIGRSTLYRAIDAGTKRDRLAAAEARRTGKR